MLKLSLALSAALALSLGPTLTVTQLGDGEYTLDGPEGDWSLTVEQITNGNSWGILGKRGSFVDGEIRCGRNNYGTIAIVDTDDDGEGDEAELDFVGLPVGVPTHYTLEQGSVLPRAMVVDAVNPFSLLSDD